jgi:hypothetical protein
MIEDTPGRLANAGYAAVVVFDALKRDPLAVELFLRASPATRREVAHRFLRGGSVERLAEKIVKFGRYM